MSNLNLSALADNLAEQCKRFEESPEYQEMLKTRVEKLYKDAIDDVFRWGDFPNRVKEAIKGAMPANINDFVDLAKYNSLVMSTLKSTWESSGIEDSAVQQIQSASLKAIDEMKIPEFVLMSELFAAFIEANAEEAAQENWEKPSILMKESESSYLSEYWQIGFEAHEKESYSHRLSKTHGFEFENCINICAIYTDYRNKTFKMHGEFKCYELYAGQVRGIVLGKKIVDPHTKFEKLMCALFYGNSFLVWDDFDPEDLYYPNQD